MKNTQTFFSESFKCVDNSNKMNHHFRNDDLNYYNEKNKNKKIPNIKGIYLGDRGKKFKNLIYNILKEGKVSKKYLDIMTNEKSMKIYSSAFTSELVDPINNYQVLEQIGDLAGNKFIVSYMYNKFPQLKCTEGVKVVARLRINYGAKQSFSAIAENLGFWQFISATNDLRFRKKKPLLEDVFEAFLGATETILDSYCNKFGIGYAIVYKILSTIFDKKDISLEYEKLYDSKTRLKELFDMYESSLGVLKYKEEKKDNMITYSTVYRIKNCEYIKIGEGSSALKTDAQQQASRSALKYLNSQGWHKSVPEIYNKFNKGIKIEETITKKEFVFNYNEKWDKNINILYSTKEKSKYQNRYQSTPLSFYCSKKITKGVKFCLKLKANPNICDTEGMYPLDLLFIGYRDNSDNDKIKKILEYFKKYVFDINNIKINMNTPVFNMYCKNKKIFENFKKYINLITVDTIEID